MCSTNNTSSSACGCGTGGNTGASIWNSSFKKQQKRPKIPKRGPGVAELEKILREQQNSTDKQNTTDSVAFPVPPSCFISHHSARPTSPCPASSNLTSNVAPKYEFLGLPSMTSMFGGTLGRNVGSGFVSPERELFPVNLNSRKSKSNINEGVDGSLSDSGNSQPKNLSNESNPLWPYSATIQKRNNQYPLHPKMNLGPGPPTSSGSFSFGLQNPSEPPSNQNSFFNFTSRAAAEIVGMKRSHPTSAENSLIPPSNFQVLPSFSQYNRPHQSFINESNSVTSFNSTKEYYRDSKWSSNLELNSKRVNSDIVQPGYANFSPFPAPEVPPPSTHLFGSVLSKGNAIPCQVSEDRTEGSYQRSESSGPDQKPFYNFLKVEDPEVAETTTDPSNGGREGGRGGMDLSLKL